MIMTSDAVNTSDDRAAAEVLHEVYAAWASGDADAFVTPYTEHATAVLPGSYLAG
jgi:ketosteroid isomerase-like protein